MIWYDRTQKSVVAGCTPCGVRGIFLDQAEADRWAMDHIARAHPVPSELLERERRRSIDAAWRRQQRRRDTPPH